MYMKNYIKYFRDVILYKGEFYYNEPEEVYLHNRMDITYTFKDINLIPININNIIKYDKIILFIEGFHNNMAHLIWDAMYPSWYGLFFSDEDTWDKDFQWITLHDMYIRNSNGWHQDILEKFSGNKITTPQILSNNYNKPLRIKLLIAGIKNLGIGSVKKNMCINKAFKHHINDPVETFINRIYLRYKIKRNNYNDNNNITDIIYIHNKRNYNGINEMFDKLTNKYRNIYIFIYINWCDYTFEEQLKILNTTRIIICGVGTARANSPFIPNGSIEIQTNNHSTTLPNYISFFDCWIGTISNYLKVININSYTKYECDNNLVSQYLLSCIENTLKIVPYKEPINIEDNIPIFINNIKSKITENNFIKWRKTYSNNINDVYKYV